MLETAGQASLGSCDATPWGEHGGPALLAVSCTGLVQKGAPFAGIPLPGMSCAGLASDAPEVAGEAAAVAGAPLCCCATGPGAVLAEAVPSGDWARCTGAPAQMQGNPLEQARHHATAVHSNRRLTHMRHSPLKLLVEP